MLFRLQAAEGYSTGSGTDTEENEGLNTTLTETAGNHVYPQEYRI